MLLAVSLLACDGSAPEAGRAPVSDVRLGPTDQCILAADGGVDCHVATVAGGSYRAICDACGILEDGELDCWGLNVHVGSDPTGVAEYVGVECGAMAACAWNDAWVVCGGQPWGGAEWFPGTAQGAAVGDDFVCIHEAAGGIRCVFVEGAEPAWADGVSFPVASHVEATSHGLCYVAAEEPHVVYCFSQAGTHRIEFDAEIVDLSVVNVQGCVALVGGGVSCWDRGGVATLPAADARAVRVEAGTVAACGVDEDGILQCWGDCDGYCDSW